MAKNKKITKKPAIKCGKTNFSQSWRVKQKV